MDFCSDSKKMNQFKFNVLFFLIIFVTGSLFSLERLVNIPDILLEMDKIMEDTVVEEYDSNNDGSIDYFIRMDIDGEKVFEIIDFNHDGEMDDLYFYSHGIIVRREVDSNFDMNIDIWVYIKDGTMIEKYEQDIDFNGDIDKIKIFGGEEES